MCEDGEIGKRRKVGVEGVQGGTLQLRAAQGAARKCGVLRREKLPSVKNLTSCTSNV